MVSFCDGALGNFQFWGSLDNPMFMANWGGQRIQIVPYEPINFNFSTAYNCAAYRADLMNNYFTPQYMDFAAAPLGNMFGGVGSDLQFRLSQTSQQHSQDFVSKRILGTETSLRNLATDLEKAAESTDLTAEEQEKVKELASKVTEKQAELEEIKNDPDLSLNERNQKIGELEKEVKEIYNEAKELSDKVADIKATKQLFDSYTTTLQNQVASLQKEEVKAGVTDEQKTKSTALKKKIEDKIAEIEALDVAAMTKEERKAKKTEINKEILALKKEVSTLEAEMKRSAAGAGGSGT